MKVRITLFIRSPGAAFLGSVSLAVAVTDASALKLHFSSGEEWMAHVKSQITDITLMGFCKHLLKYAWA